MEHICWNFFVAVSILVSASTSQEQDIQLRYQIRLVGQTPFKGRLEVFYDGEWGTVCDDSFTPYACELVCKQLGFWNGTCISIVSSGCLTKQNGDFEIGSGHIWLDDVKCTGYELRLDECQHAPWGKINCFHDEDVGCVCTPNQDQCNSSRHRIIPLDGNHSGVGIVEVQDDEGVWGAVCDDHWDDNDAITFCKCLGYEDTSSFRALSVGRPLPTLTNYNGSFIYDEVHCPQEESLFTRNLWDCETKVNRPSKCDIRSELALVQCDGNGVHLPGEEPDRINTTLSCDGINLVVCVQPLFEFDVQSAILAIHPSCKDAMLMDYDHNFGFCYNINLIECQPIEASEMKIVEGLKNYCYDISLDVPNNLFFLGGLTKRGCCSVNKSLQVEAVFTASNSSAEAKGEANAFVSEGVKPKLSIPCFRSDSTKHGLEMARGEVVDRGSTIHCKVVADFWDDDLQLVVKNCRFLSLSKGADAAHVASYTFIENKCVVTDLLNVKLFNGGKHLWGLSFYLPKFESVDEISLTCDVFLCDLKRDGKQLCDRSCNVSNFYGKYDEGDNHHDNNTSTTTPFESHTSPISSKGTMKIVAEEATYGLRSNVDFVDIEKLKRKTQNGFLVPPNRRRRRERRSSRNVSEHFIGAVSESIIVRDTGEGPLIIESGIVVIEKPLLQNTENMLTAVVPQAIVVAVVCMSAFAIIIRRRWKR